MDKVSSLLIVFIVLFSCSHKRNVNNDDCSILFEYRKHITVDLKARKLKVEYAGLVYIDTIVMSKEEDLIVRKSFDKNRIELIKGEFAYPECPWLMPSFEDRIDVYLNGKLKSTLSINIEPNCIFEKPSSGSQESRVIHFHNDLRRLLENNSGFIKALDTLNSFRNVRTEISI